MSHYVDGFVIPVPHGKLEAYRELATAAGKIWREYGALDYKECVLDDGEPPFGVPFGRLAQAQPGETVIFSYIVYESRAHRDEVNALVMKDARLTGLCNENDKPFDPERMAYGGFNVLVSA